MESRARSKMPIWTFAAAVVFLFGLACWTVFFLRLDQSAWMYTLLVNPLGIVFGGIAVSRAERFALVVLIGNVIMTLSFFIYMLVGYLIEFITQ